MPNLGRTDIEHFCNLNKLFGSERRRNLHCVTFTAILGAIFLAFSPLIDCSILSSNGDNKLITIHTQSLCA